MRKLIWPALLALVIPLALAGCGGGDGDDNADSGSGDSTNQFAGTWALTQTGDGSSMFIVFNADGSFIMKDTADGPAHMTGTYTVSGNVASGPLKNPGVGIGEIIATLNGSTLDFEFIEHWHNPYKHIFYTGTKI
jgi:hypothetical protein